MAPTPALRQMMLAITGYLADRKTHTGRHRASAAARLAARVATTLRQTGRPDLPHHRPVTPTNSQHSDTLNSLLRVAMAMASRAPAISNRPVARIPDSLPVTGILPPDITATSRTDLHLLRLTARLTARATARLIDLRSGLTHARRKTSADSGAIQHRKI